MAGPVPYRTDDNKYAPSFPPVVYYRDTFGLDRETDNSDNDSITTKSTVRTTMNIYPIPMNDSTISRVSNMSQSYHVEQVKTTKILTANARTLFVLSMILLGSAVQLASIRFSPFSYDFFLLTFAIITIFYDGSPYFMSIVICILMFINGMIIFAFVRWKPTLNWLKASCGASALSCLLAAIFFIWTTYLINTEDKFLEKIGVRDSRSVTSTRIAMYLLELLFSAIHGIPAGCAFYSLYNSLRDADTEQITQAYFLSEPQLGHQKILVPIELRQVREDREPDHASIGVQTSGSQSRKNE